MKFKQLFLIDIGNEQTSARPKAKATHKRKLPPMPQLPRELKCLNRNPLPPMPPLPPELFDTLLEIIDMLTLEG
jgi:hypothetical protein